MIKGTITLADGTTLVLESASPQELGETLSFIKSPVRREEKKPEQIFSPQVERKSSSDEQRQQRVIRLNQQGKAWSKQDIQGIVNYLIDGDAIIPITADQRREIKKMFPGRPGDSLMVTVHSVKKFLTQSDPRSSLSPSFIRKLTELGYERGTQKLWEENRTYNTPKGPRVAPAQMIRDGRLVAIHPWDEEDIIAIAKIVSDLLTRNPDARVGPSVLKYIKTYGIQKNRSTSSILTMLVSMKGFFEGNPKHTEKISKTVLDILNRNNFKAVSRQGVFTQHTVNIPISYTPESLGMEHKESVPESVPFRFFARNKEEIEEADKKFPSEYDTDEV